MRGGPQWPPSRVHVGAGVVDRRSSVWVAWLELRPLGTRMPLRLKSTWLELRSLGTRMPLRRNQAWL